MYDIFLSYRRETGTEVCSDLCELFEQEGYRTFFDQQSMRRGDFEEQIDKAITECTFLLLLLGSETDLQECITDPEHDWILHEVGLAMEYGKIVLPVKFKQGFEFPDMTDVQNDILLFISRQQLCDISGPGFARKKKENLFAFMNETPITALRKEYVEGIVSHDYLEWEIQSLRNIYHDCDLLTYMGKIYPVVIRSGSDKIVYPFNELTNIENLMNTPDSPVDYASSPLYEEFRKVVGPNIHYPNLYGFTNVGMLFDESGKVTGFKACPRTYRETVYTEHILQYEMWHTFQSLGKDRYASLNDLPIRKKIHADKPNDEVLWSGCNRSSLCDVCMAILVYDEEENNYDIAVATRTSSVACHPGYLSIIPSGGFELYELEDNQSNTNIRRNFKIVGALYREYIEEIFGDKNFEKATGNDDLRRLKRNEHIQELCNGIDKTYFLEFLGVVLDLTSLRPTFAFVLRIDDPKFLYNNNFQPNEENKHFSFVDLALFDTAIKENEATSPLLPESAGVYSLLKQNHLYREALEKRK